MFHKFQSILLTTFTLALDITNINPSQFCDPKTGLCLITQPVDPNAKTPTGPSILPTFMKSKSGVNIKRNVWRYGSRRSRKGKGKTRSPRTKTKSKTNKSNLDQTKKSRRSTKKYSNNKKYSRYLASISKSFNNLSCHCRNNQIPETFINCNLLENGQLSPKESIIDHRGNYCYCNLFESENIWCGKSQQAGLQAEECPKKIENCIEEAYPVLVGNSVLDLKMVGIPGTSNFEKITSKKSPCKICLQIGCTDPKTNMKYQAGQKFRKGCYKYKCPKKGGLLKSRNTCTRKSVYLNQVMKENKNKKYIEPKVQPIEELYSLIDELVGLESPFLPEELKANLKVARGEILPDLVVGRSGLVKSSKLKLGESKSKIDLNGYDFKKFYQQKGVTGTKGKKGDQNSISKFSSNIAECCQKGQSLATRTKKCNYSDERSNQICQVTQQNCCQETLNQNSCQQGQNLAKNLRPCKILDKKSKFLDEKDSISVEETCCDCCWVGLKVYNELKWKWKGEGGRGDLMETLKPMCELWVWVGKLGNVQRKLRVF